MFMKNKFLIFIPTLLMGSMITISSASWFSAWVGLEINLMSMAPILINKNSLKTSEAVIKYFIFQALASTILIFFIFVSSMLYFYNFMNLVYLVISACLIIKIGMAPFQFWFPQVMMCSDWFQCLILLTWQKLAPFSLLSCYFSSMMIYIILFSALLGSFGGINQFNIKILLAYSSILHSSWVLSIISLNSLLWVMYLMTYSIITFILILPLYMLNIETLNNIFLMKMPSVYKSIFFLNFLSLAGLPPFLGFSMKILVLISLFNSSISLLIILTLIFGSLISFYFYLRLLLTSLYNNNWVFKYINSHKMYKLLLSWMITLSFFANLLFPYMVLLT